VSASTSATYIFSLLLPVQLPQITLEPCALNAEFQHFILRDLIKFPYFVDTIERGDWGVGGESKAQRHNEDRVTLQTTLVGVSRNGMPVPATILFFFFLKHLVFFETAKEELCKFPSNYTMKIGADLLPEL
jgi:hypothetical protein